MNNVKVAVLCEELAEEIKKSYESGVTMEEAEKLASRFLHAQFVISNNLRTLDLDARMKKSGLKAVKAAVYHDNASKAEKKPSDTYLQNLVDLDENTLAEQRLLDTAEVERDLFQNYLGIFKDAHVHFRTIAKGRFD